MSAADIQSVIRAAAVLRLHAEPVKRIPTGAIAMKDQYLRSGFGFALAHAIEEAGEFLAAAGKTQRWGRYSVNPELPPEQQETNEAWMRREIADLRGALERLEATLGDEQKA